MLTRDGRAICWGDRLFFGTPMTGFNLNAVFLPIYRADPQTYWLGLGIIALIDAIRISVGTPGDYFGWLMVLFFVSSIHINRLRDAGRSGPLVIASIGPATLAKAVVGLFASTYVVLLAFLQAQGVDLADSQQVMDALSQSDFQRQYDAYITENPEALAIALGQVAWPSLWAFWGTIGLIGLWFSRMRAPLRMV